MKHIIFLHGFCEHSGMWDALLLDLDKRDYVFHSIDLPGFGLNKSPVNSIESMAEFVFTEMDSKNINRATIIGHSMGGYVALEMAAQNSVRIDALGLVHSHGAADQDEKKQNRIKLIDFIQRNGPTGFLKEFSKKLLSPIQPNKNLQTAAHNLVKNTTAEAIIEASRAMIDRRDHTQTIQEFSKPILWIIGNLDTFVSIDVVVNQAVSCPQAQVEVLDNVGHLCMYEVPKKTAEIVNGFLSWSYQLSE